MAVDRCVCYWCAIMRRPVGDRVISPADAVFESLCGHDECPTVTFHGLCLMEFRESTATKEARDLNNQRIRFLQHLSRLWGDDDGEG